MRLEATAGTVSPDRYDSFSDLLFQLARDDPKYESLRANVDFKRCMDLMQLNNPNPYRLNENRLKASVAQAHQQFRGRVVDSRLLSASTVASNGSPKDLTISPEYNPVTSFDLNAAGGVGAHTSDVLLPSNATFASETSEGLQHSDIVQKDLLGYLDTTTKPADDSMDLALDDSASGGRSRSRKRSVSKRTRRKGVAKKQNSKKNKRQSRRKVRRASSRRSRK